jgi:hypothetical protein
MSIQAIIFGQSIPVAGVTTKLFTAAAGKNYQGSILVQNQGANEDKISIARVPGGGAPVAANWLPEALPLEGGGLGAHELHLRLAAGDEVYIKSLNGTSVFHADGLEVS